MNTHNGLAALSYDYQATQWTEYRLSAWACWWQYEQRPLRGLAALAAYGGRPEVPELLSGHRART